MPDRGSPRVVLGGVLGPFSDLEPGLGRLFFVVGAFDGLHRGHTYLLARLRAVAALHRARPAVITFDHHPDEILVGAAPPVLCDPLERIVRFGRAGVDVVVVQHFDAAVRLTAYADFVGAIARRIELAGFLMTPDAAFGHERRGTPAALAELGRSLGFAVEVVEPLDIDGRPVRSTEIRADIAAGRLDPARRLLGRSVAVAGRIGRSDIGLSGAGLGGAGFADGPLSVEFELPVALPPAGHYRVDVEVAWAPDQPRLDRPVSAIAGVGPGGALTLELHGRAPLPAADRLRIRFIGPAD
jgi:riboflavin kinase/FMN adenylyltransferase